jgi:hypothetical protein
MSESLPWIVAAWAACLICSILDAIRSKRIKPIATGLMFPVLAFIVVFHAPLGVARLCWLVVGETWDQCIVRHGSHD